MPSTLLRLAIVAALGVPGFAQAAPLSVPPAAAQVWTWDAVKDRFQLNNKFVSHL